MDTGKKAVCSTLCKNCVDIVEKLWNYFGTFTSTVLLHTSRVLPHCGIISWCGNSEEISLNQTVEKLWN